MADVLEDDMDMDMDEDTRRRVASTARKKKFEETLRKEILEPDEHAEKRSVRQPTGDGKNEMVETEDDKDPGPCTSHYSYLRKSCNDYCDPFKYSAALKPLETYTYAELQAAPYVRYRKSLSKAFDHRKFPLFETETDYPVEWLRHMKNAADLAVPDIETHLDPANCPGERCAVRQFLVKQLNHLKTLQRIPLLEDGHGPFGTQLVKGQFYYSETFKRDV